MTVWFLVIIMHFGGGDALVGMPFQVETQQDCADAGVWLLMDNRNPDSKAYCIEADDEDDLVIIMNAAFNFGGQGV